MAKIGDIVRYLNTVGGGRIVRIDGNIAYVDEDGFETPVLIRECVVVTPAAESKPSAQKSAPAADAASVAPRPAVPPPLDDFIVEETPGGEKLNLVLAYEAVDLKRLSSTTFDTYLVNDSNYYLNYAYLTRAAEQTQWTLRHAGTVEPGIQIFVGELTRDDLPEIDRVCVQFTAYKKGKPFALKQPASVDLRLDATKFCRLHCFRPNPYFDQPVIALDIVTDDRPAKALEVDGPKMQEAMNSKIRDDRRAPKPVQRRQKATSKDEPLVVDLHIHELVDNTRGLSNSDMLNLQIDAFRKVMDSNLKYKGKKIVFIHGKGEGVLRQALVKELNYRYKSCQVQDASFREYGFGATQVTIR